MVPWTVPITRLIIFTLYESMGMKVRHLEALQPHKYTECVFPIDEIQVPQQL